MPVVAIAERVMEHLIAPRADVCRVAASGTRAATGRSRRLPAAAQIAVVLLCVGQAGVGERTLGADLPTQISVSAVGGRSEPSQPVLRIVPGSWQVKPVPVRQMDHPEGEVTPEIAKTPQPNLEVVPLPEPSPQDYVPAAMACLPELPLSAVSTNIEPAEGDLPPDVAADVFPRDAAIPGDPGTYRLWQPMCYCWEASALCHRPLYFEEVNLERYGYPQPGLRLIQPVLSGARFFATVPALPYLVSARPPCECVYTLGHYRPGSCVPHRRHWPELRPTAASVEAALVTGLVFLIP